MIQMPNQLGNLHFSCSILPILFQITIFLRHSVQSHQQVFPISAFDNQPREYVSAIFPGYSYCMYLIQLYNLVFIFWQQALQSLHLFTRLLYKRMYLQIVSTTITLYTSINQYQNGFEIKQVPQVPILKRKVEQAVITRRRTRS